MNEFEQVWRKRIKKNVTAISGIETADAVSMISDIDPVTYSRTLISSLKGMTIDEKIALIFSNSACHMPHNNLENVRKLYQETNDLEKTRQLLEDEFKVSIKKYKDLTDIQLNDIIQKGWGAAGLLMNDTIIATKIPSMFHQYFAETDEKKKKYYYCHCPRVRKELLEDSNLDSIYCNCGGGFYKDMWEFITGGDVTIDVIKNLFDGDDVCQFEIKI